MQFTIKKDELVKALKRVQGFTASNSMPILANILIVADVKGIELTGTNLEIGLRGRYEAAVEIPGAVTVAAKKLYDIARELPDDNDILVKVSEANRLTILSGSAKFKLLGLPKEEFPALPEIPEVDVISADSAVLAGMIKKASYAAADNDARFVLNGLFIQVEPVVGQDGVAVKMVATNGHRLSLIGRMVSGQKKGIKVVIPKKAVIEMKSLLEEQKEGTQVNIGFSKNHALLKLNELTMTSKLIDGDFPQYANIFPAASNNIVTVQRDRFIAALKRVAIITSEKSKTVKFCLQHGNIELSTSHAETGDAKEELTADFTGDPVTIGLNIGYIADVFSAMTKDKVRIQVDSPTAPILLSEEGDCNHMCVIMPVRL